MKRQKKQNNLDTIPLVSFGEIQLLFIFLKVFGEIDTWAVAATPAIVLIAATILTVIQSKIKDKLFK